MKLCEWGFHAYRHVSVKQDREIGVMYERRSWTHQTRCKRCGHGRIRTVWKFPRIKIDPKNQPKDK